MNNVGELYSELDRLVYKEPPTSAQELFVALLLLVKYAYSVGLLEGQGGEPPQETQEEQDLEDILRFNGVNCRH